MPGLMFACFLLGGVVPPFDYCTNSFCAPGTTNVGCNPPPMSGGGSCASYMSPSVVTITPDVQSHILQVHNTYRSDLALGNHENQFPSAARMPTLLWDDDLAAQAGNNARSCLFAHDQCRNTQQFHYAGQNLAKAYFFGGPLTIEGMIDDLADTWWSESLGATSDQLSSYPSTNVNPPIGHFTQMASDRTWKVGCALQSWVDYPFAVYYFVCDYSFTNMVDQPVYVTGTTGSGCTTGTNPDYPGLCSVDEVILSVP